MSAIRAIAVVIPARNESGLVGRCLESVRRATSELGKQARLEVTVTIVADGCDDDTARVAAASGATYVLQTPPIGVGEARRTGVALALDRTGLAPESVWIANTDADSVVGRSWLQNQLQAAGSGAHARIGAVRPDFRDMNRLQVDSWRLTHRGGAARGHVHGANLGVLASSYRDVGGFRPLALHEDVDLVRRLRRLGVPIAADATPDVVTSGRSVGRASGGYATYLATGLLAPAISSS